MTSEPPRPPRGESPLPESWSPPWKRVRSGRRKFTLLRFLSILAVFFSIIFLLAYAFYNLAGYLFGPQGPTRSPLLLLAACCTPIIFLIVLFLAATTAFDRYVAPLIEVMDAADKVAEGNLSVRVKENVRGDWYRRLTRRFNRMVEELDKAEQQRRNLTNDVAHELRNPLHVIQGNLEGILDGVYQPTPEHISATLEETRLLSRLVEDLQVLSLADAGQLPLHKQRFPVRDLLSDVAASFDARASELGVHLQVVTPDGGESLELNADYDRLDQVLSNLVANALRYTPQDGSITLKAEARDGSPRLMVTDTGQGIPPEDMPYIFERFWKADRARTHKSGSGSGLGLAIAKQLVQSHGGTISAESTPAQGTCFTIDLPPS